MTQLSALRDGKLGQPPMGCRIRHFVRHPVLSAFKSTSLPYCASTSAISAV